jgi:two-component system cell cycle response regulator CtrA
MRVLLVEDDTASAKSIERMLKAEDFLCDRMDCGAASQEVEELCKYDLIILDLPLADTDGQQLIR